MYEANASHVSVRFLYTDFAEVESPLLSTPVRTESVRQFCARAAAAVDPGCAPLPRAGLCAA